MLSLLVRYFNIGLFRYGVCGLFILVLCLLTACDAPGSKTSLTVVSTTGMIHDIVRNIAHDKVDATVLMGPGVDPHLYKATESDVLSLARADIIFYNGLHLEAKLGDVLSNMAERSHIVAVTDRIDKDTLRMPKEFDGFYDPHVWFDVRLWLLAIDAVEQALINKDKANKEFYIKHATQYRDQLKRLDRYILNQVSLVPNHRRILVTAHDAFGYFGDAYGFEVYALQGISTQSEAAIYDVDQLANFIVMRKIPAIFVESSISKRHILSVQEAVKAKGWHVVIGGELFSDALGEPNTPEGTYIGMLKHNIHSIVDGLK
tara:strand:+ start:3676 stop:4626 length:951 start_codon:yes stop_codon:yes gene_type:complete